MSERMVELHRARLLAAGKGSRPPAAGSAGSAHPNGSSHTGAGPGGAAAVLSSSFSAIPSTSSPYSQRIHPPQTPQQAAATALHTEDQLLQRFLQRLHHERDDSRPGDVSTGPTVPTALTRRLLHRQGVCFLDSTVAAVASAASDRFLATVLQQAVACRDQRLRGAEMARQARKQQKRHTLQYEQDVNDRRRRKAERLATRETANAAAIAAANALAVKVAAKEAAATSSGTGTSGAAAASIGADGATKDDGTTATGTSKQKKKRKAESSATNGVVKRPNSQKNALSDDEASYDSIDEEEAYYRNHYADDSDEDDHNDGANSEDEEDDEMMLLRDLSRPLEAWDFHLEGKLGLDPVAQQSHADDSGVDAGSDDASEEGEFGLTESELSDLQQQQQQLQEQQQQAQQDEQTKSAEDSTKTNGVTDKINDDVKPKAKASSSPIADKVKNARKSPTTAGMGGTSQAPSK